MNWTKSSDDVTVHNSVLSLIGCHLCAKIDLRTLESSAGNASEIHYVTRHWTNKDNGFLLIWRFVHLLHKLDWELLKIMTMKITGERWKGVTFFMLRPATMYLKSTNLDLKLKSQDAWNLRLFGETNLKSGVLTQAIASQYQQLTWVRLSVEL